MGLFAAGKGKARYRKSEELLENSLASKCLVFTSEESTIVLLKET